MGHLANQFTQQFFRIKHERFSLAVVLQAGAALWWL